MSGGLTRPTALGKPIAKSPVFIGKPLLPLDINHPSVVRFMSKPMKTVSLKLSQTEIDQLTAIAEQQEMTKASLLKKLILNFITNKSIDKPQEYQFSDEIDAAAFYSFDKNNKLEIEL